jgi:hypothetical protein
MVSLPAFTQLLAFIIDTSAATLNTKARSLRTAGMFTRGTQGESVPLNNRDAVNLMLAGLIDQKYGSGHSAAVKRARALPRDELIEVPAGFTQPLAFASATDAGTALDSLLEDVRTGRIACDLSVTLDAAGRSVTFAVSSPDGGNAILTYNEPSWAKRPKGIDRQVTVHLPVLQSIGRALGE